MKVSEIARNNASRNSTREDVDNNNNYLSKQIRKVITKVV